MAYGTIETTRALEWIWSRPQGRGFIVRPCPMIWGHRGQGKTQLQAGLARKHKVPYIGFNVATVESPGDMWGMPDLMTTKDGRRVTTYGIPEFLVNAGPRGILHIDEPNRANRLVRQALTDLFLSYRIGPHPIPPGWLIVATANPAEAATYDVEELDAALMDRFVHIPFAPKPGEVKKWMEINRVHPSLLRLMDEHDEYLGIDAVTMPEVSPSPRSWELFHLLYDPKMDPQVLDLCARGCFGDKIGNEVSKELRSTSPKLATPTDVMTRYVFVREYIKVWGSLRYSNPAPLQELIGGVIRWIEKKGGVKSLSRKERGNLQRFFADLSVEMQQIGNLEEMYDQSRGR